MSKFCLIFAIALSPLVIFIPFTPLHSKILKTNAEFMPSYSLSRKNKIYVSVNRDGTTKVVLNRISIVSGGLYSNPIVNNNGDYAYILSSKSFSNTCIILNKKEIKKTCGYFNWNLIASEKELFWLSSTGKSGGYTYWLNRYDIKSKAVSQIRLEQLPMQLKIVKMYGLVLLGFNESQGSYTVYFLSNNFKELNKRKFTSGSVYLRDNHNLVDVVQVMGTSNLATLFYALKNLYNYQFLEPFSSGNNKYGRLSWLVSYRLKGMVALYSITGNRRILDLIRSTVSNMISHSENSIYYSTRYSIDSKHKVNMLVDNAMIYDALLDAYYYLKPEVQKKLLKKATSAFNFYEKNWHGKYYFSSSIPILYDGVPMPLNMQNSMGLAVISLYKITKKNYYLKRVRVLYNNFKRNILDVNHKIVWHYWPEANKGWGNGVFESKHSPNMKPSNDILYEDTSHASTNIEFIYRASLLLGIKNPISIEKLGNQVCISPFTFSRFISGDTEYNKPSLIYIPIGYWIKAKCVRKLYARNIKLPYPDFDSSGLFYSYALAAKDEYRMRGKLSLTVYRWKNKGQEWQYYSDHHFVQKDGKCHLTGYENNTRMYGRACSYYFSKFLLA